MRYALFDTEIYKGRILISTFLSGQVWDCFRFGVRQSGGRKVRLMEYESDEPWSRSEAWMVGSALRGGQDFQVYRGHLQGGFSVDRHVSPETRCGCGKNGSSLKGGSSIVLMSRCNLFECMTSPLGLLVVPASHLEPRL
jgi:hypothetical protein